RHHAQTLKIVKVVAFKVIKRMRPRPDHAHLSPHYVPELRQFIQAVSAQPFSNTRDSRVACDLEKRSLPFVAGTQIFLDSVSVGAHCAELIAAKTTPF